MTQSTLSCIAANEENRVMKNEQRTIGNEIAVAYYFIANSSFFIVHSFRRLGGTP
jgi:hypothetical protein